MATNTHPGWDAYHAAMLAAQAKAQAACSAANAAFATAQAVHDAAIKAALAQEDVEYRAAQQAYAAAGN